MWDWDVLSGNTLPPPPTQEKKIPPLCPGEMRDRESSCLLFIRGGVSTYAETFLKVVSSLHSLILLIFTTFSFYTLTDYFFSAFNCVPVYQFINSLIHQRNPRYSFLFRILICVTFSTTCPPSLSTTCSIAMLNITDPNCLHLISCPSSVLPWTLHCALDPEVR